MGLTSLGDGTGKRPGRDAGSSSREYASFATMRLYLYDDRAVLRPAGGMYGFGTIFLLIGLIPGGILIALAVSLLTGKSEHVGSEFLRNIEMGTKVLGMIVAGFFGALFGGAGLWLLLTAAGRRVVFDKPNKVIIVQQGTLGRKREEFSLGDLTGVEVLETTQSSGPGLKLELVFGGPQNRRLTLMHHADHELLLTDAQRLACFLKTSLRGVNLSRQAQQTGDWTMAVPQSPLYKSFAGFKIKLKVRPNGDLAFVPSLAARVFLGTITISRVDGRIHKPGRKGFDLPVKGLRAVQLLSFYFEDSTFYEINLVLPDGRERVHLVCHGNAKSIRADAKLLAEFLDIPLLDQAR